MSWACASCGGDNPEGMRFCGHCGAPAEAATATAPQATDDVTEALRSFVAGPVADKLVESGGQLPEERRLITALFADVSGFTSLADRLDPEELLEVIDPVISALSSIVGRYEGYVEKFAGDALLALFGAPIAHEDDSSRALLVATEMHRELARVATELPHEPDLTLHVGVNSGHGIARILGSEVRMDYGVLGDAVILAQRLESAAPPGETYVSESTVRLTQKRFAFEPVGELTLKGKSEPVPAWRLIGQRARPRALEPEAAATGLVGRGAELAASIKALEEVVGGNGRLLTVAGEPGVGKSRLTDEVRKESQRLGLEWLETRCLSYGTTLPYWPYAELLRRVAGMRADDSSATALERLDELLNLDGAQASQPFFAALLGLPVDAASEVTDLEPEAFRRRLHEAFAAWVRGRAAQRPHVLAIEDVHWIDGSSLALTSELAALGASAPLALYLTGRLEALASIEEVRAARGDLAHIDLRLEPLDAAALEQLLSGLLPGALPESFADSLFDQTRGNPFFVEEIVLSLKETGALVRDNGAWRMERAWDEAAVPTTIEGALAARIDLLPKSAAGVLQTAAVVGRRFRVPLLVAVEPAAGEQPALLDELVERLFLDRVAGEDETELAFHHVLVQEVAYSRLLRRRRRELHLRVAEVAEALYGARDDVTELLARHLYLGEAGAKAVDFLVRAGERAKRLYANAEAIVHFGRAAEVADRVPAFEERRVEILLELADLHDLVGDYDEALRLYAEVRERWRDLRGWRGMATVLRKQGQYKRALVVVEDAFVEPALEGADLTPLWLEQGWSLSVMGRFDQAIEVLEAALLNAGGANTVVVGQLLLQLARAETVEGRLESALQRCFVAKAIFDELNHLRGLATTHRIIGDVYRSLGTLDAAEDWLRRGLEVAERIGSVEEIGGCLVNLALVAHFQGRVPEAIAFNQRAIAEFERFGHASGRAQSYSNLAWMLSEADEYDEALVYCEKALDLARSLGLSLLVADVYDTMAAVELGQGAPADAGRRAEEAADLFLELGAAPRAVDSLQLAAKAWESAGEKERARTSQARARALLLETAS
jgi:class 3 adenylate cyclase/tetratricopeptide (TPR) repeat protein